MFWKSMQWVAVAVVLVGGVGIAGGLWSGHSGNAQETPAIKPKAAREAPAAAKDDKPAVAPEEAAQPEDPLKEEVYRALARRNLRKLALAFQSYHDANGRLPAPATTTKTGQPLLSWRVALLPYLDEDNLYKKFKQDEPWDSAHNKKLLAKMPRIFAPIGVKTRLPNSTFYQVFVGPGALYCAYHLPYDQGAKGSAPDGGAPGAPPVDGVAPGAPPGAPMGGPGGMAPGSGKSGPPSIPNDIPDGMSNTILIVEAGTPVPWTKPEDIPYDAKKPIPKLGGQFSNIFHAAFADGVVRALPKTLDVAQLRAGITPAGGEAVDWEKINRPPAGSPLRQKLLDGLQDKNATLKEEVAILTDILAELKSDVDDLRWAIEKEKMLAADPKATALKRENEALEKSLEKGREEMRKLILEVRKMKEEMKKKSKK